MNPEERERLERKADELIKQARATLLVCPTCGPRPELNARFCSKCGRQLSNA